MLFDRDHACHLALQLHVFRASYIFANDTGTMSELQQAVVEKLKYYTAFYL